MKSKQKLKEIKRIYDDTTTDGVTGHIRLNLSGVLHEMRYLPKIKEKDRVIWIKTIERCMKQLASIEKLLGL